MVCLACRWLGPGWDLISGAFPFISCLLPGSGAFSGLSHMSQCHGTDFFFPIKIEKRKEERDISWVHQPILWPSAFRLIEVQVLSGAAVKHFESSRCVFRGFLHEFHFYHLKQSVKNCHLQHSWNSLATASSMSKPWIQGHRQTLSKWKTRHSCHSFSSALECSKRSYLKHL